MSRYPRKLRERVFTVFRRIFVFSALTGMILATMAEPLRASADAVNSVQREEPAVEQESADEQEDLSSGGITAPLGILKGRLFQKAWEYISENANKLAESSSQETKPKTNLAMRFDRLSVYLDQKMEEWNGSERWAVMVIVEDEDLSGVFGYKEPMTAASLIKLFVAGACMKEQEDNGLPESTLRRMDVMINASDNEACNALISLLKMDNINAFIEEEGFGDSLLRRRMLEARTESNENMTSVKDCGEVLHRILNGTYVSEEASARIMGDLKEQQRRNKIPAGLPEGVESGNKTGELGDVENDAAVIWGENCTYILCVMSENVWSSRAQERIRELSAEVYSILNEE